MTVHWLYLAIAALLLGFPVLLSREVYRRIGKPTRGPAVKLTRMTGMAVNWLDFVRAAGGGLVLSRLAVEVAPGVSGAAQKALALQAAVLVVGVLLQVVRFRKEVIFLAPVFYLSGIALAMPPWDVGLAAVVVGCGFALATKTVACLLPIAGVTLAVYGYLLNGVDLTVMLTTVLLFLPAITSILFLKDLCYVDAKRGWGP